ncbi:hypothetical protein F5X96DRAFT_695494 [Biscogniauxia mediterranea]|nr:hypothetical protein F5X96DRAFT_695494 [Biscogniauxia mediterranea]
MHRFALPALLLPALLLLATISVPVSASTRPQQPPPLPDDAQRTTANMTLSSKEAAVTTFPRSIPRVPLPTATTTASSHYPHSNNNNNNDQDDDDDGNPSAEEESGSAQTTFVTVTATASPAALPSTSYTTYSTSTSFATLALSPPNRSDHALPVGCCWQFPRVRVPAKEEEGGGQR